MPIAIRKAQPGEAARLGEIGFAAWRDSPLGHSDNGRTSHAGLLAKYVDFCWQFREHILVAERAGDALGWGARENGDNYISDLWVRPEAQKLGAGGALLAALEREIRGLGFDRAELETNAVNAAALQFYRGRGYSVVWSGEKFAPALGYIIQKVRLSKHLDG